MYRKTVLAASLAMLTSLAVHADTIMDTTPSDNQATFAAEAGQTFVTGTLGASQLTYITAESRTEDTPGMGSWIDVYVAVYVNDGGSTTNWTPGALVGVSTNSSDWLSVPGNQTAVWHFDGPALSDSTGYLFMFVDSNTNAVGVGTGLSQDDSTVNGTVISGGGVPFSGNFDIACVISTDAAPALPEAPPKILSFTASETTVIEGDPVTLSWVTEDADTLTLNPGEVDVTGTTSNIVVVSTDTTYELIASNSVAVITNSVSITAVPAPVEGEFVTSYGPASNRAGPMWGQGITITNGVDTTPVPATVQLQDVTFRLSDTSQTSSETAVYLHVYDAFTVDGSGNVTSIGNLMAVSTNTMDMTSGANAEVTWAFAGDELDSTVSYNYILSTLTSAATAGNAYAGLTSASFKLDTGNPYSGGDAWRANSGDTSWDMEFKVVTLDQSPAAPATITITGPISGGTQMVISWNSEAGKPYSVETNDNLVVGGNWDTFMTGLEGNGSTLSVTNTIGPDETFYRVISE